jgi:3-deoxy-manno-octulosonate cytidylyltransferase (CMP-KDO synthetase)
MKKIIGIIPARMASTRFPGKPLATILGMPMLGHVFLRSKMSKLLTGLYIATCDSQIKKYADSIGAYTIMTKNTHERASDRTAEAMLKIEKMTGTKVDIVVMVQGDEPLIRPQMIDLAVKPLLDDKEIMVTNLMSELNSFEEENDPNEVKVVVDNFNNAVYFSREAIPSRKKTKLFFKCLKQVCIIPFRRDFLLKFNLMKQTPLEIIESVDMLRIIENGYKVKMVHSPYDTYSVDTRDDLRFVEKIMKDDVCMNKYLQKRK